MATSTSRLSFSDCYDILDRALATPRGLRLSFPVEGDARHFRTRLHAARSLHRRDNAATYPEGDPKHGSSEYDPLTVKLRANGKGWVLLIEPVSATMQIEEIED